MRLISLFLLLFSVTVSQAGDGPAGNFGGIHYGRVMQDLDALKASQPVLARLDDRPWTAGGHIFTSQNGGIVGFKGDIGWRNYSGASVAIERFESDVFVHFGRSMEPGALYHAWFSGGVGWMSSRMTLRQQPGTTHWDEAFDGSYTQSELRLAGPAWELLLGTDIRTQIPNMDTGAWLTLGILVSYKQHFGQDNWVLNGKDDLRAAPKAEVGGASLLLTVGYRY